MRCLFIAAVALLAGVAQATGWSFADASVGVSSKGAGVGAGSKEKYAAIHASACMAVTNEAQA